MITALDATALIYAMDKTARSDRPEEQAVRNNVHDFIAWIKETQRDEIQIPVPAFAEFLAFYSMDSQSAHITQIMKRGFHITPTDAKAAIIAAEAWSKLGTKESRKKMQKEANASKQCLKTDILIVATARAHKAERIITADSGIISIAKVLELQSVHVDNCKKPVILERYGKNLIDFADEPDKPKKEG